MDGHVPSASTVTCVRNGIRIAIRFAALVSFGVAIVLAVPLLLQVLLAFAVSGSAAASQATTITIAMNAIAVFAAATPGLALMFAERKLTRWLAPMPRPECPECGYPVRSDAIRCPECGLGICRTTPAPVSS